MGLTGWIGVDFDGTLATDETCQPIPAMVDRVKRWRSKGIEVRIVTARVNEKDSQILSFQITFIMDWCKKHIGEVLPITCAKDYAMYQLWDDRAVQVEKDTGRRIGDVNRPSAKHTDKKVIDEESGYSE